ncbi:hypothetical protein C5167_046937 [Papaver somniferum]|uniref:Uncharacterized protein n=1 Tax=Papaver somniferum TaxID=3469 RepID=A0A4Y7LHG1_PAPSO|nr:hypothetical protein C5167_046937 [Papaver somniferum]
MTSSYLTFFSHIRIICYQNLTKALVKLRVILDVERQGNFKELVHIQIYIDGHILENPESCPSIGKIRVKHRGKLLTL